MSKGKPGSPALTRALLFTGFVLGSAGGVAYWGHLKLIDILTGGGSWKDNPKAIAIGVLTGLGCALVGVLIGTAITLPEKLEAMVLTTWHAGAYSALLAFLGLGLSARRTHSADALRQTVADIKGYEHLYMGLVPLLVFGALLGLLCGLLKVVSPESRPRWRRGLLLVPLAAGGLWFLFREHQLPGKDWLLLTWSA